MAGQPPTLGCAAATELIERSVRGEWTLWFSPLTLANVHYVYRKQAGAAKAIVAIHNLAKIGNIATMASDHVTQALASGQSDFEDAMQIACASSVPGLSFIITRNLPDYAHGSVPAMTAQSWLEQSASPSDDFSVPQSKTRKR